MPEADEPITPAYVREMNAMAKFIDTTFNPGPRRRMGFVLLVFDLGRTGRMNYISNAQRADILVALKELIARWEGRMMDEPGSPQ